jgi:hypothetical protein
MRTATIAVLVLSFIVFCTGCQAFRETFTLSQDISKLPEVKMPRGPLATYFDDRVLDFMDWFPIPFRMRFSMGPGILVHAMATKVAQAGIGFVEDGDKFGFKGRQVGYWRESRGEIGASVFYLSTTRKELLVGNRFLFEAMRQPVPEAAEDIDVFRNDDRDFCDIGVTVHAFFFGFDLDLPLREFADFWLGILTLDMQKDDTKNRLRRTEVGLAGLTGPTERAEETIPPPPHMTPAGEGKY